MFLELYKNYTKLYKKDFYGKFVYLSLMLYNLKLTQYTIVLFAKYSYCLFVITHEFFVTEDSLNKYLRTVIMKRKERTNLQF